VTVREDWVLWTCIRSSVWTLICDRPSRTQRIRLREKRTKSRNLSRWMKKRNSHFWMKSGRKFSNFWLIKLLQVCENLLNWYISRKTLIYIIIYTALFTFLCVSGTTKCRTNQFSVMRTLKALLHCFSMGTLKQHGLNKSINSRWYSSQQQSQPVTVTVSVDW